MKKLRYLMYALLAVLVIFAPVTRASAFSFSDDRPPLATLEKVKETQKLRSKRKAGQAASGDIASIPLVMIVVGFKNCAYSDEYDWSEKTFTDKYSVSSYYKDMSYDQFTFAPIAETSKYGKDGNTNVNDTENDGVIHVNLDLDHKNWGDLEKMFSVNRLQDYLKEALKKASAYFKLSDYDSNNNGEIENTELAVCYILAGYDYSRLRQSYGDDLRELSVWPHQYVIDNDLEKVPVIDGVKAQRYVVTAEKEHEVYKDLDSVGQENLGALTHELGHYLGLYDLYNTDAKDYNYDADSKEWGRYKVGYLSVMGSGTEVYNPEADAYLPVSLDAWSKYILGWVKPKIVYSSQTVDLNSNSSEKYNIVKVINLSSNNMNEYYLLENRVYTGWDSSLSSQYKNSNGGVVAWHIDKDVTRKYAHQAQINTPEHRPGVMPLFLEKGSSGYFSEPISSWDVGKDRNPFYANNDLTKWNLPLVPFVLYGTGDDADKRSTRTLSYSGFNVLSDPSDSMKVDITMPSITPSSTSETLCFGQALTITKESSSISDDSFDTGTNSDTSVVDADIIDGKVVVKAKRKEGTATLTIVSEKGATAKITVNVKKGTIAKLKKTKGKVRVKKSLKIVLKKGSYAGDKIYRCKSSNKKIAKVTNTGNVTGKKKGKAVITVTLTSGATKKFKVTVV